jgi:polyisoprenoid-binding protein YceI/mono/diheme cytochrome c family protein
MRRHWLLALTLLLSLDAFAEPRLWTLQKPSARARFTVEAPLDAIHGASGGLSGALTFAEESWASSAGRIRIDLTGFSTGLSLRDEDLRDQFFQVDKYPEATLIITGIERVTVSALTLDADAQADAVGTLSLHGQTRPVRIPITVRLSESRGTRTLLVRGNFDVTMADYGISRPARLFLKLGTVAQVNFEASFSAASPSSVSRAVAAVAPEPTTAAPPRPPPPPAVSLNVVVARRTKPPARAPAWDFALTSPEGRGERLFRDPSVGSDLNANSCWSCHNVHDERTGFFDAAGHVRSNSTLWDSGRRSTYWRGFAENLEQGIDICVRKFMLKPAGASKETLADLAAYLRRISPDVQPPLDYAALVLGRTTAIDRPTGGNAERGALLAERHCNYCHAEGALRPPLTPGLYEADYLVKRVRWIAGHDAKQMPPLGMDRLRDSELRDIVTYLVGDDTTRIFHRKPKGVIAPRSEAAHPATPVAAR